MKKIIYGLCVGLLISTLFSCQEKPTISFETRLAVSGLVEVELTQEDFNKMPFVDLTISRTGKDGAELIYNVTGILLKDVLAYLELTPDTIILEAKDGYTQTYDQTIYNDELTILAFFVQDTPLLEGDGPIWALAGNSTGNFWVRQLIKITLE